MALLEALAPAQLTADPIDVHSQLLPHLPSTRGRPLAAWATTAAAAAHECASAAHLRCHQLLSPAHCEDSASFPPLQVCDPRETSHRHIPAAPPHKQCAYVNAPGSQRFVIFRSYAPLCRYCGIADEASKTPTAQNTSHWVPLTLGDAEACSRGKSHGCWAGTWLPASVDRTAGSSLCFPDTGSAPAYSLPVRGVAVLPCKAMHLPTALGCWAGAMRAGRPCPGSASAVPTRQPTSYSCGLNAFFAGVVGAGSSRGHGTGCPAPIERHAGRRRQRATGG